MTLKTILYLLPFAVFYSCGTKSIVDSPNPVKIIFKEEFKFQTDTITKPSYVEDYLPVTRIHYSDSSFADQPLICSADSDVCAIRFKKTNSFWYVKTSDGWQEFYSPKDSLLKVVYFKKEKYILKPIGENYQDDKRVLLGFTCEQLYVYSSHNNNFFFDPDYGVVIIDGGTIFIRDDFKKRHD